MKKGNKIVYSLNVDDIQSVALDAIDRKLTEEEIKKVTREIYKYIDWYDIIDNVISQNIKDE